MKQSEPSSQAHKLKQIALADSKRLLAVSKRNVVLDTNILIQACQEAGQEQRDLIIKFIENNYSHISETIHYELLRNLSIDSFRKRHRALGKIIGGTALTENEEKVKEWFEILTFVCLEISKNNTKRIIYKPEENDRWIIACALAYGIDYIATTDHGNGFPKEIFDDDVFNISSEKHELYFHLKKINMNQLTMYWNQIQENKGVFLPLK